MAIRIFTNLVSFSKSSDLMGSIKGYAWNCGGLRRHTASTLFKVMYFEKTFRDFDFFFFLETHHKDWDDIPNELLACEGTHHIVHSQVGAGDTHTGIIGLIKKKYDVFDIENTIQGRVLGMGLFDSSTQERYRISAVYLPTNQNLDVDILRGIVRGLRSDSDNYMILGDFNFIDHAKDKKGGLGAKDRQLNKIWVPFLDEMDMVDPFREQNPNRRVWSFVGTGVAGNSRIDRVYVGSANVGNFTNMRYVVTPFRGHRVFSFNIKTGIEWGRGYYKLNTSLLRMESMTRWLMRRCWRLDR